MTATEKGKSLIATLKQLFQAAEAEPAATDTPAATTGKLADGTEITYDKLEVGGIVTAAGAPLAAGTYTMEDGTTITVGDAGVLSEVKAKEEMASNSLAPAATPAPATTPAATAQAGAAQTHDLTTAEGLRAAYNAFAEGTVDMPGIMTMMKALMEYSFGWQIREAQDKANREAAIKVYTENLAKATADLATTQETVQNQQKMMKQMFEVIEELAGTASVTTPVTEKKKFSFVQTGDKGKPALSKFTAALQEMYKQDEAKKNKTVTA